MNLNFRDLLADEIELRVGSVVKNDKTDGFTLLLYKNARVDMALLDEVVGVNNWQREHKILGNDIYCRVGIYDEEKKQWIWREDAGAEANTEAEKSKASDSFKRACVNFGLGRCLYSAPFVWINTSEENNPKTSRFFVKEIEYENHKISKLVIYNEKTNKEVYRFPKGRMESETSKKGTIQEEHKKLINDFLSSCTMEQTTKFFEWLNKKHGTMSVDLLSAEQGVMVCKSWKLM